MQYKFPILTENDDNFPSSPVTGTIPKLVKINTATVNFLFLQEDYFKTYSFNCKPHDDLNSYRVGESPLTFEHHLSVDDHVTSLHASSLEGKNILMAGTKEGRIMKVKT